MSYRVLRDGLGWNFCEQCDQPIPIYENGAVKAGYVSPELWKFAMDTVEGIPGVRPISRVVCNPCYRAAFAREHPGIECQMKPSNGELPEWVLQSLQTENSLATQSSAPTEQS